MVLLDIFAFNFREKFNQTRLLLETWKINKKSVIISRITLFNLFVFDLALIFIFMFVFSQPLATEGCNSKLLLSEVKLIWVKIFSSPRLVTNQG